LVDLLKVDFSALTRAQVTTNLASLKEFGLDGTTVANADKIKALAVANGVAGDVATET